MQPHLIRNSLDFASGKERKGPAAALKEAPKRRWTALRLAGVSVSDRSASGLATGAASCRLFAFPPVVRRIIYSTTNYIESMHPRHQHTRASPSDEAATKLIWLALLNMTRSGSLRTRVDGGDGPVRNSLTKTNSR
jgi:transposase-like protein